MKVSSNLEVSGNVFVRTVTYVYTGEVQICTDDFLVLRKVAWIADAGRWNEAIKDGTLSEVEPYPDGSTVAISRGAIVEICDWPHALPREVR